MFIHCSGGARTQARRLVHQCCGEGRSGPKVLLGRDAASQREARVGPGVSLPQTVEKPFVPPDVNAYAKIIKSFEKSNPGLKG